MIQNGPDPLGPRVALLAKLGSIVIHFEEGVSKDGHAFDYLTLGSLINDPEVEQWLAGMTALGLLPVKRVTP